MTAATNRRRYLRVRPKQLGTRIRSGDDLHIGLGIENISMGGAFVRCNTPMKVGREVVLEVLRAGASQPLELEGKVTSSVSLAAAAAGHRSAGMGISFDPLPPHLEARLEGLIVSIDPSALKQPAARRVARAPMLLESTQLTANHVPKAAFDEQDEGRTFEGKTFEALRPGPDGGDEAFAQLRRELDERDELIAQLRAENNKLQQRLLKFINHGG